MTDSLLDVAGFDQLCAAYYTASDPAIRSEFERKLLVIQADGNAWKAVPDILAYTQSEYTQFSALKLLEDLVSFRWASISRAEQTSVTNLVLSSVWQFTSQSKTSRLVLNKLDGILVKILRLQWPREMPYFIDNLVAEATHNPLASENAFHIFRMLSEEMHSFCEFTLTSTRRNELRTQLKHEFIKVVPLFHEFFQILPTMDPGNEAQVRHVQAALDCLAELLSTWLPRSWIIAHKIPELVFECARIPPLHLSCIKCLQYLTGLAHEQGELQEGEDPMYRDHGMLSVRILGQIALIIPVDPQNGFTWEDWRSQNKDAFVRPLLATLTSFIRDWKDFQALHRSPDFYRFLNALHLYLCKLATYEELDIVRKVFDYFDLIFQFVVEIRRDLYPNKKPIDVYSVGKVMDYVHRGIIMEDINNLEAHCRRYVEILYTLSPHFAVIRSIIFDRMPPPQPFTLEDEETNEVVEISRESSEEQACFMSMGEVLFGITLLDNHRTMKDIGRRLESQTDPNQFSHEVITRLSRALATIAARDEGSIESRVFAIISLDSQFDRIPTQWSHVSSFVDQFHAVQLSRTDLIDRTIIDVDIIEISSLGKEYLRFVPQMRQKILEKLWNIALHSQSLALHTLESAIISFEVFSLDTRDYLDEFRNNMPSEMMNTITTMVTSTPQILECLSWRGDILYAYFKCMATILAGLQNYSDEAYVKAQIDQLFLLPSQHINMVFTRMQSNPRWPTDSAFLTEIFELLNVYFSGLVPLVLKLPESAPFVLTRLGPLDKALKDQIHTSIAESQQPSKEILLLRKLIHTLLKNYITALHEAEQDNLQDYDGRGRPQFTRLKEFLTSNYAPFVIHALNDFYDLPTEYVEPSMLDTICHLLGNLNSVIPVDLREAMILPIIHAGTKFVDDIDQYSDLGRPIAKILALSLRHNKLSGTLLDIPRLSSEEINSLTQVSMIGAKSINFQITRDSLIGLCWLVYWHGLTVCSGIEYERRITFNRLYLRQMLDIVWGLLTSKAHKGTFGEQIRVFRMIWDTFYQLPTPVFDHVSNQQWMRSWFEEALFSHFTQLKETPGRAGLLFDTLWSLTCGRMNNARYTFADVLKDFLLELAQFRGINCRYILSQDDEIMDMEESKPAKKTTEETIDEQVERIRQLKIVSNN